MTQRTFLELTHNPFTPPREGFFGGADRRSHLDQIRHLNQWSRRILMVTGPFGIGKSTLYRELSSNLEPSTKAARLSGAVVTSDREIMLGIAQGFGVAVDSVAHMDEIVEILARYVQDEHDRGVVGAVLIDDAQLLDYAAINALIKLATNAPLRLVLFAEATIIANITKITKKHELEWFEIRLTGFPAVDVRGYLEWRFSQAQYRGRLPFTDEQVEKITQRSGGNPNVIDFMANELLAELESGGHPRRAIQFPRRHLILAVVLVVLVGLLYQLYQQPERASVIAETEDSQVDEATTDETTVETLSDPTSASVPIDAPSEVISGMDESQSYAQESESITSQAASDVLVEDAEVASPAELAAASDSVAADLASDTTDSVNGSVAEPVATPDLAPSVSVEEESSPSSGSGVNTVTDTVVTSRIPVTESAAELAPQETSPVAGAEEGGALNGLSWIRRQDPSHYTLQLMTLSKRSGGAALISRQRDPDEFALYPVQRDGKTMYILVYGVYSSQQTASNGAAGLSGELASIKPWVRRFGTIQSSLE